MVEEVGTLLLRSDLDLTPGVNLFYMSRPDSPDDVVTLYEYAGSPPEFDHGSRIPEWESPRLQVLARSVDGPTAQARARIIYLCLSAICAAGNTWLYDVGNNQRTQYRALRPLQQPFQMGFDGNRRALWVVNFECIRRPIPG